jgi:hypothetical protein
MRGGFAFDVGAGGDDQFGDGLLPQAFLQLSQPDIIWAFAAERGEFAAEDVVESVEAGGVFDGQDLRCMFDNAEQAALPGFILTDGTGLFFGEVAADGAGVDALSQFTEGGSEIGEVFLWPAHDGHGEPFRGSAADAGQAAEAGDDMLERLWILAWLAHGSGEVSVGQRSDFDSGLKDDGVEKLVDALDKGAFGKPFLFFAGCDPVASGRIFFWRGFFSDDLQGGVGPLLPGSVLQSLLGVLALEGHQIIDRQVVHVIA